MTEEFADIESRLARYQPTAPSDAARQRTAALFEPHANQTTRRWKLVAAACIALPLIAAAVWWTQRPSVESTAIPEEFAQKFATLPQEQEPPVDRTVDVVVMLFTDWQCPPCADFHADVQRIIGTHNRAGVGRVEFVVRDWPFNRKCNLGVQGEMHQMACELATAVRIARKHGRESDMIDWIRSHRSEFNDPGAGDAINDQLRRLVGGIDLLTEQAEALTAIQADVFGGGRLGVNATPTVFVNGRRLTTLKPQEIDWAIRLELGRRKI